MSHLGHGTWSMFRRAVKSLLAGEDENAGDMRRLHMRFSDLGFAEFFIDGTDRWRAFRPVLAVSRVQPEWALLCGARTPRVERTVRKSASRLGAQTFELSVDGLFSMIKIHGSCLREVAEDAGIAFEPDMDRRLAKDLATLQTLMQRAPRRSPP